MTKKTNSPHDSKFSILNSKFAILNSLSPNVVIGDPTVSPLNRASSTHPRIKSPNNDSFHAFLTTFSFLRGSKSRYPV